MVMINAFRATLLTFLVVASLTVLGSAQADELPNIVWSETGEQPRASEDLANDILSGAFKQEIDEASSTIKSEDQQRIDAAGGLIPGTGVPNSVLDQKSSCGTQLECLDMVAKKARELPPIVWPESLK